MYKKLFTLAASLVLGIASIAYALPVFTIQQGGTGTSTLPSFGQLLMGNTTNGYNLVSTSSLGITGGGGSGTVTSVSIVPPTGLSAASTTCNLVCILTLSLASGYNIPLTASTTNWNNFYNASATLPYYVTYTYGSSTYQTKISTTTDLSANTIQFNVNPTLGAFSEGRLYYDATEKVLAFDSGTGETQQIGQETWLRATNKTGSTILNGQVVYVDGSQGNRATVNLAKADTIASSSIIGMATQDIANNQAGMITIYGEVHQLNTSAFTEGDSLYLSNTVAGGVTNVVPTTGISVKVGVVTNSHATQGKILITTRTQLDTDGTFTNNSNAISPTQKAVKTYVDTSLLNYPTFTYASSTFVPFSYASSTYASTSWIVSSFPTFTYASSTFASTSWVVNTFAPIASPTFTGTVSAPNVTVTNSGGLRLRDLGGTFNVQILPNETNTVTRTLYLKLLDASRNLTLGGDLNVTGNATTSGTNTGDQSINGLATTTFVFSTTTTGGDFSISTTTAGVQFNTPSSSASNRGFLTSADWTTFNNKLGQFFLTASGSSLTIGNFYATNTISLSGNGTSSGLFAFTGTTTHATSSFNGPITFTNASGTGLTSTSIFGNLFPTGLSNAFLSVDVAGKIISTTTPGGTTYTGTYPIIVSGSVISSGFSTSTINNYTAQNNFVTASATGLTAGNLFATSTFSITNLLNSWLSTDANGKVVATTTFPGGGSLTGGVFGYAARWLSPTTLGTSTLIDDGNIAGINATSTLYEFYVKGDATHNPFAVASSSGDIMMAFGTNGTMGVATSTFNTGTTSERLRMDCGSVSENCLSGYGNVNDFLQHVITNYNTGTFAEAGYTAQNSASTATSTYAWLGINGTGFNSTSTFSSGRASDVTLIGAGNDMYITNASSTGTMYFQTGGTGTSTSATTQLSLNSAGRFRIYKGLGDSTNATGTNGQVLQSTGTSTLWVTPTATVFSSTTGMTIGNLFATSTATISGNTVFSSTTAFGRSSTTMATIGTLFATSSITLATTTANGDITMNARIVKRTVGYASAASTTINIGNTDIATTTIFATTTFVNFNGTTTAWDGQPVEIRAMATTTFGLFWGNFFSSSTDLQLPSSIASGTTMFLFEYDKFRNKLLFTGKLGAFNN